MFSNNSGNTANSTGNDSGIGAISTDAPVSTGPVWTQGRFAEQWYVSGNGFVGNGPESAHIDITRVWSDYTGAGVRVALIDNFFDIDHQDLQGRFDLAASRDLADAAGSVDIRPDDASANHGTMVAAVLGANGMDGSGMTGTAYGATLVGYVLRFGGTSQARSTLESHLQTQLSDDISVINNSWSFNTAFADDFGAVAWQGVANALRAHAEDGRDGLGTVQVIGAGNDRQYDALRYWLDGDNTNNHSATNSRYMITVGATDADGVVSDFSTPGASVFVAAPGEMILTATPGDGDGNAADDYAFARGTSFATPIVSGVTALMLEANPTLGYRDVQDILALSSRRVDPQGGQWLENGASVWNGGGFYVNSDVGFGLVDAHAAVRLAETWNRQQTAANEVTATASAAIASPVATIDGDTRRFTLSVDAGEAFKTQWIELAVDIEHPHIGDLTITLVSPSGMRSVLLDRPGAGTNSRDALTFTLSSNQFWGEDPNGVWTLEVSDAGGAETGLVRSAALTAFGSRSDDDSYVFTDDFAALDRDPVTVTDSAGVDTLNLAAISTDVIVDLAPGAVQTFAGKTVTIAEGSVIENAITGDGNDQVAGNDADNTILTGRGDDLITMTAGMDSIDGGQGTDTLVIDGERNAFALHRFDETRYLIARPGIDAAAQILTGVEMLSFTDGAVDMATFLAESADRFPIELVTAYTTQIEQSDTGETTDPDQEGEQPAPIPTVALRNANLMLAADLPDAPRFLSLNSDVENAQPDTASFADAAHAVAVRLTDPDMISGIDVNEQDPFFVVRNLIGSFDDDQLFGNDEDNLLEGGEGADTLTGELGDDTYNVDSVLDVIVEADLGGSDTVFASVNYRLGDFIESIRLTGSARIAIGNDLDNLIVGNDTANVLDGGLGADQMRGGRGNDRYVIDDALDSIVEFSNGGMDIVFSTADWAMSRGIERVYLRGGDDLAITGNSLANIIVGNDGDNTIDGGGGIDLMRGGRGDDSYVVNHRLDRISEARNGGFDSVSASTSYTLGRNVEALTLAGESDLAATGNSTANVLTGNDGDNRIAGKFGNDELTGGLGADSFVFDTRLSATANVDSITDFVHGTDTIALENRIFSRLGAAGSLSADLFAEGANATTADQRIIYDKDAGALYYDRDGVGGAGKMLFARLGAGTDLDHTDFLVI